MVHSSYSSPAPSRATRKRTRIQSAQRRSSRFSVRLHDAAAATAAVSSTRSPRSPSEWSTSSAASTAMCTRSAAASDICAEWRKWRESGGGDGGSVPSGFGVCCAAYRCHQISGKAAANVIHLRLQRTPDPRMRRSRDVWSNAGLCVVIRVVHAAEERDIIVLLSAEMRCFCLAMRSTELAALQLQQRGAAAVLWLQGGVQRTDDVALDVVGITDAATDCATDAVGTHFTVDAVAASVASLPCFLVCDERLVRVCPDGGDMAVSLCKLLADEASRQVRVAQAARVDRRRTRSRRQHRAERTSKPPGLVQPAFGISTPAFRVRTRRDLQKLADLESEGEEDMSDYACMRRHRAGERNEKHAQESIRDTTEVWAVCDNPDCRKWRVLPAHMKLGERDRYFCGGRRTPDERQCDMPDDWLVRCLGEKGAARCQSVGVSTIEGLDHSPKLLQALQNIGYYYDSSTLALLAYDG